MNIGNICTVLQILYLVPYNPQITLIKAIGSHDAPATCVGQDCLSTNMTGMWPDLTDSQTKLSPCDIMGLRACSLPTSAYLALKVCGLSVCMPAWEFYLAIRRAPGDDQRLGILKYHCHCQPTPITRVTMFTLSKRTETTDVQQQRTVSCDTTPNRK